MYSYENPDERVSVLQLNSELQHAQLELLSAHCATHQLRLHYSADDLARFGRRDVLRKSAEAASALNEFYSSIEKKIPRTAPESASLPATDRRTDHPGRGVGLHLPAGSARTLSPGGRAAQQPLQGLHVALFLVRPA